MKAHRKNIEEDEKKAINAIKEGVMGGGFRKYMAANSLEDESEAMMAAWKRANRIRGAENSDEEGFSLSELGNDDDEDNEYVDDAEIKMAKMIFTAENSQSSTMLSSVLDEEESQLLMGRMKVKSRTSNAAPSKTKVVSDFIAPPLLRSTSSKGSFMKIKQATLNKYVPINSKQSTSSRSSFVFATGSRDAGDSKDVEPITIAPKRYVPTHSSKPTRGNKNTNNTTL
eukprot:Ihof_evm2s316 gene=Ihof_evmTU2s316